MPQFINTNVASLNTQRALNQSQGALQTSLQRLSSGLRINSAKDDAAGLAISERFTTQIRGLNQAIRNANDGVSFAQTAEGALSTVGNNLQRIRELAVQSINDTNSAQDRQALNNEVSQLIAEVNRVANATQFNGQNILDGSLSTLTFQVGANQNQTIQVDGVDTRTSQLGARAFTTGSLDTAGITAITDLVINGVTASTNTATTVDEVITAVNAVSADSGIQAFKASTTDTGTQGGNGLATTAGAVSINGISLTMTGTEATDIDLINAVSTQTGVTAAAQGTGIILSNTDGSDIVITGTNIGGAANTFSAGITFAGDVSEGAFTMTGTLTDENTDALATTLATQADDALTGVDVLSGSNANDALRTIDFALNQVNGLRAELGAIQIRFETTISNLQVSTENLSAARSRIRDADFAAETAELTRNQILQQAGVAMLSQANAAPQNVLALLQ